MMSAQCPWRKCGHNIPQAVIGRELPRVNTGNRHASGGTGARSCGSRTLPLNFPARGGLSPIVRRRSPARYGQLIRCAIVSEKG